MHSLQNEESSKILSEICLRNAKDKFMENMYIIFHLSDIKKNTIFRFKLRYFFNSLCIA